MPGSLSQGSKVWHTQWTLSPRPELHGHRVGHRDRPGTLTRTVSFRTLSPKQTFHTQIFEGYTPDLRRRHADHADVQRADHQPGRGRALPLQLTTSKPVVGAWYWDGNQHLYFQAGELLAG